MRSAQGGYMLGKPTRKIEWTVPRKIQLREYRSAILLGMKCVPLIIAVCSVFLLAVYFLLRYYAPLLSREVGFGELLFTGFLTIVCCSVGVFFLMPTLWLLWPYRYSLTGDRIKAVCGEQSFQYRWSKIPGYSLKTRIAPEKIRLLVLHLHDGRTKTLFLPEEAAERIIDAVAEKIPMTLPFSSETSQDIVAESRLTGKDVVVLSTLTVSWAASVGYLLAAFHLHFTAFIVCDLLCLVIGPGTLGCLLLRRTRGQRLQLLDRAIEFNGLAALLLMMFVAIFMICYACRGLPVE
jgi:hypothetical protein